MSKTHFKPEETLQRLEPVDMGLVYTSLQRIEVKGTVEVESNNEEVCLFCIEGTTNYTYEDIQGNLEMKDMIYMPINSKVSLSSENCVLIKYGAPCERKTTFSQISFKDVNSDDRHKVYGKEENSTKRDVWNYIDEKFDSSRFLVGVCYGNDGGWTAWPPHEHGQKREEVYIYFDMGDSFGIQCVYDDLNNPIDVALIQEGHLVAISGGYHPNVGCPKGGIRYIYCMVSTTAEDREFMDLKIQKIYGDKLE